MIQIDLAMNWFKRMFENGFTLAATSLVGLISYFTPILFPLIFCITFTLTDLYYGIKSSKKQHKENKDPNKDGYLVSRKGWNTLHKFCTTVMTLAGVFILDKGIIQGELGLPSPHLVGIFAGLISTCEFLSLLEHWKGLYPDIPWIRLLSKVVKSKSEKYLDITIERDDYTKVKDIIKHKVK